MFYNGSTGYLNISRLTRTKEMGMPEAPKINPTLQDKR